MRGAVKKAQKLADEPGYYQSQQFKNSANPEIHRETNAEEIISNLGEFHLDYFVAGVGNGGTLTGIGEILKKKYGCRNAAVEPKNSPVLSGGKPGKHKIQGVGAGFIPGIYNLLNVDQIIQVKDGDALSTSRKLAREVGILAGISAGANVFAPLDVAKEAKNGKVVLFIIPDVGERYLSTDFFNEEAEVLSI